MTLELLKSSLTEYYHYSKWQACHGKGIRLFTVFQDDWNTNKDSIKEEILKYINQSLDIDELVVTYAGITELEVDNMTTDIRLLEKIGFKLVNTHVNKYFTNYKTKHRNIDECNNYTDVIWDCGHSIMQRDINEL